MNICCFSTEGSNPTSQYVLPLCESEILTGPVMAGLCRRGSSHCVFLVSTWKQEAIHHTVFWYSGMCFTRICLVLQHMSLNQKAKTARWNCLTVVNVECASI